MGNLHSIYAGAHNNTPFDANKFKENMKYSSQEKGMSLSTRDKITKDNNSVKSV